MNEIPGPVTECFTTAGGVAVERTVEPRPYAEGAMPLIASLDARRGVLLASSFEYPGRYTRWDIGFVDPPLKIVAHGRTFRITALNTRGEVLIGGLTEALAGLEVLEDVAASAGEISGTVAEPRETFPEELRSKQPTVFSMLRAVIAHFAAPGDGHLGLYGAFGYDLAFQFEPVRQRLVRAEGQRDLVLFLPDEILIVDHRRETASLISYEFTQGGQSTHGLPRGGAAEAYRAAGRPPRACDHEPGAYAASVRLAKEAFRRGDLFEVVPGQTFYEPCPAPPSEVFRRLKQRNPAPYGALMNLGEAEYLVAASPEMYVRVDGRRVETCPISGTIARGADAIGDAAQILALLRSDKDASELTMCTDVDRNDKSRVCVPGSVRVIGRRQIEMYSRLIHTVDHVEGTLRAEFDALDAFLAHTWAVTVTGAPKHGAMQFIEDHERSPRLWYGGAIGFVGFDGNMNTGLTLRTVRIKDGIAEVRAGATLLFESDPDAEEAESRLKAAALLDAISRPDEAAPRPIEGSPGPGADKSILMIDHEDSFVHTLAGYLRETGAEVVTLRAGFPLLELARRAPDLVVLSPGPGRPTDFGVAETVAACLAHGIPVFGVCLGLQGVVEHFGGSLATLDHPAHGKPSAIRILGGRLFEGMPAHLAAGRYHSLYAVRESLPAELAVTAETEAGLVMAVEHTHLPVAAVQFHPESILTLEDDAGRRLIENAVSWLTGGRARSAVA